MAQESTAISHAGQFDARFTGAGLTTPDVPALEREVRRALARARGQ